MVNEKPQEVLRAQVLARSMTQVVWELAAALRFPNPWPNVRVQLQELRVLEKRLTGLAERAARKEKPQE